MSVGWSQRICSHSSQALEKFLRDKERFLSNTGHTVYPQEAEKPSLLASLHQFNRNVYNISRVEGRGREVG